MLPLHVMVASGSGYRRWWYSEQLQLCGMEVSIAYDGVDCIEQMRNLRPDVVLLEPSLLWGGTQGVLAVRAEELELQNIPIVLIADEGISADWYQLAQYPVQGLLLRRPSRAELADTLTAASHESCSATR